MLTVVTAMGLPLAIIPVLSGMNVERIPFKESAFAFWGIATLVPFLPASIVAWWLRRDRR